jgi:cell division protein FtsL
MVAQIIQKQINIVENKEKRLFFILFSVVILLVLSYGFLLNKTMMNAVYTQNIEKNIKTLSSEVNSLEFQYLNMKNNITLDTAKSKGFVVISSNKFASIDSVQKKVSLSINEN